MVPQGMDPFPYVKDVIMKMDPQGMELFPYAKDKFMFMDPLRLGPISYE